MLDIGCVNKTKKTKCIAVAYQWKIMIMKNYEVESVKQIMICSTDTEILIVRTDFFLQGK